jgi:hypothetical protein
MRGKLPASSGVALAMPIRLEPVQGLPTRLSAADEEGFSKLVSMQLDNARKAAENWRNGLVAIIGLIAAFSVIKGPSEISGLGDGFGYVVGILLALALASAAYGAWLSLDAAFGSPSLITREQFQNQGGIDGYRLNLARHAANELGCAKAATVVTLVLLALAVAVTWYGPRSNVVMLAAEGTSGHGVCGKLVSSADGYIELKPAGSGPTRFYLADLIKVTAVERCP